jgi:hypothetical protein
LRLLVLPGELHDGVHLTEVVDALLRVDELPLGLVLRRQRAELRLHVAPVPLVEQERGLPGLQALVVLVEVVAATGHRRTDLQVVRGRLAQRPVGDADLSGVGLRGGRGRGEEGRGGGADRDRQRAELHEASRAGVGNRDRDRAV